MAFTIKYPNILFFLISLFFSSTCRHIFGRTVARKSSFRGYIFVQGLDILNIYIEFTTQHLQIVQINYKIIKYFPANTRKRLIICN